MSNTKIIQVLEAALIEAKDGRVEGLALTMIDSKGRFKSLVAGEEVTMTTLAGAVGGLWYRIQANLAMTSYPDINPRGGINV